MSAVNENKISLEELLYYIVFSLLLCLKGIGLDESSILFRIGLTIAIVFFIAKILIGKYSVKELFFIGVVGLWGSFIFFHVGTLSILIYALIILGMKNVSVSRTMKIGTVVWSVCFVITTTAAILGSRTGVQLVHEKLGLGPLLRESLGYSHPNVLHVTYIVLMAFVLFGCKKKNTIGTIFMLLIGDALVFIYSLSYTGLLISFLLIGMYIYFLYRNRISLLEEILIMCILPFCFLLSTVIPYLINDEGTIYSICNSILNNRIWAIKVFFDHYNATMWGQRILEDAFSLDNSYVYALAWYGIVFLVIIYVGYWIVISYYLKMGRRKELAIITTFLIAGLTEQFLFNASIKNITFVFMGEVVFTLFKQKEKELNLLSRLNHTLKKPMGWETSWKQKLQSVLKQISWKKVVGQYIIINIIVLLGMFLIKTNSYNQVYVNEKLCDCSATLVPMDQITVSEDTLIIGHTSDEDRFYYFTTENSNLILVKDIRYKIVCSIYISVLCVVLIICYKGKRILL